jgi:hypothetical protein
MGRTLAQERRAHARNAGAGGGRPQRVIFAGDAMDEDGAAQVSGADQLSLRTLASDFSS